MRSGVTSMRTLNRQKLLQYGLFIIAGVLLFFVFTRLPLSKVQLQSGDKDYIIHDDTIYTDTLKIQSGKNTVVVAGPRIYQEVTMFNLPFVTKKIPITENDYNISEEEIVNSSLNRLNIPDNSLDMCKSFGIDWIVCRGGLGSAESIAAHYENNNWKLLFNRDEITDAAVKDYFVYIISQSKAEGMNVLER